MSFSQTTIPAHLLERDEFRRLAEALDEGRAVSLDGIWGGACALAVAALQREFSRRRRAHPLLVVLPSADRIDTTASDIELFAGSEPFVFPPLENIAVLQGDIPGNGFGALNGNGLDGSIDSSIPVGDDLFGQRVRLLKRLLATSLTTSLTTSLNKPFQHPVVWMVRCWHDWFVGC